MISYDSLMKAMTLSFTNSGNRLPVRVFVLIPFLFASFALPPEARAVCQQGCDTSSNNTFLGDDALINNTTGVDNTAVGFNALVTNTTGRQNTATGVGALQLNTTGSENTANGDGALSLNTDGHFNTATGSNALFSNTTGTGNTATGQDALESNTTGSSNTATGSGALLSNSVGINNTATGSEALNGNTTGVNNTATGFNTLVSNTTGNSNSASGMFALRFNTTGSHNIALGFGAGSNITTESNNIDIGSNGIIGESNTIRIGKNGTHTTTRIAGISGAIVPTGVTVIVDSTGHLGTTTSSARYKEAIKPMATASETLHALEPVTFRYKKELDPENIAQFGLVAEQVEKLNPDLVARDEQGKPYTVRYDAVNAMLLNEFLKEHQTVQELKKQVAELTAGLQNVSTQLEQNKMASRVAANQ
jgi:hypothetical protein